MEKQEEAKRLSEMSLSKEFEHDRDAYTEGKGEFVRRYTDLAKRIYIKRH